MPLYRRHPLGPLRDAAGISAAGASPQRCCLTISTDAATQLGRALRDYFFWSEREHLSVPCAGKPGEVALMNSHDAWDGYLALVPEEKREAFETVNGLVAARLVLQMPFLRPGAKTSQVKAPIYFAICGSDSVCPPNATRAYAKKAPRAEITDYEDMVRSLASKLQSAALTLCCSRTFPSTRAR